MKNLWHTSKVSIDMGGQTITCLIAGLDAQGKMHIQGMGTTLSQGIFAGQLDDITLLKKSLMSAVCDASIQAKKPVRQANLTLSGGFFRSEHAVLRSSISDSLIREKDIQDMIDRIQRPGLRPIHIIPLYFTVDQQTNIHNPCGMAGVSLFGHFHIVWVQENTLKTLHAFFKDCNIRLNHVVASCVADALCCFDEDERNLGMTLVNIGAYYTTASLFIRGKLYDQVTVPVGGHHVTEDIARAYGIKVSYAEKIKTAFGAALVNLEHYHKNIPIFSTNNASDNIPSDLSIPYTSLVDVIQFRCEKMIDLLKKGMENRSHFRRESHRLYLTGGGSHLQGIGELFQRSFGRIVRIVSPEFPEKLKGRSNTMTSAMGGLLYHSTFNFGAHPLFKKKTMMSVSKKIINPFFTWIKKLC